MSGKGTKGTGSSVDDKARRAELLARAQKTRSDRANYSPHEVANKLDGWGYFIIPHDVKQSMRLWYRNLLTERGYEAVGEADQEYVPGDGRAEIWRCPPEVADHWEADRHDWTRSTGAWDGEDGRPHGPRLWQPLQDQRDIRRKLR